MSNPWMWVSIFLLGVVALLSFLCRFFYDAMKFWEGHSKDWEKVALDYASLCDSIEKTRDKALAIAGIRANGGQHAEYH